MFPSRHPRPPAPWSYAELRLPASFQMAPGGVEPPHADSKSAALSTELRGRARTGYRRYDTTFGGVSPRSKRQQAVDQDAGHRLAGARERSAEMRCQHDVRQADELLRNLRLVDEDVEAGPNSSGDELAHEGVLVDDGAAGRVDDATALLITPSRRASMRPSVSRV